MNAQTSLFFAKYMKFPAKKYQKQGKVLILAPDDCCGMETLTKDKSALDKMYHKGYRDAKKIPDFVK